MRARPDGTDDLFRLGRRENELHVRRRLFNNFEQCVEPAGGHHVRFVNNEDLVAVACRGKHRSFAQVTRVVHTAVACRVNFDHVKRTAAIAAQLNTTGADTAGRVRGPLCTVQAAGEHPR